MRLTKIDLRKELKQYYQPPKGKFVVVRIPKQNFIMIDGSGAPEDQAFGNAIQAIYGLAFTVKFTARMTLKKDYPVMPLEGLWWVKGGGFDTSKRKEWLWTLMIIQPDFIEKEILHQASEALRHRKGPGSYDQARLEPFDEGLCVQTMYLGPYSGEGETIVKMETFARDSGYREVGKHHEIYIGDPRRAKPSKLRTVIRHPVERVNA